MLLCRRTGDGSGIRSSRRHLSRPSWLYSLTLSWFTAAVKFCKCCSCVSPVNRMSSMYVSEDIQRVVYCTGTDLGGYWLLCTVGSLFQCWQFFPVVAANMQLSSFEKVFRQCSVHPILGEDTCQLKRPSSLSDDSLHRCIQSHHLTICTVGAAHSTDCTASISWLHSSPSNSASTLCLRQMGLVWLCKNGAVPEGLRQLELPYP